MSVEHISAQDEVFDFLIARSSPEEIIAYHPSEIAQERLRFMLDGHRNSTLTAEEQSELDEYMMIEHVMRRLKIRARQKLAGL